MKTAAHKKPGKIETRLSMVFMALIVIIGIGVFMRQYQINPAVLALRPEARQQSQHPNEAPQALIDTRASEILPFSPPERFDPDTLYEKINGRADLYLSSGFVSLETQRFTPDPASGRWVELFVYDMGSPENAFSVFSTQRRNDARSDDIATHAYRTDNALFMVHANLYLELIGTDASASLQESMDVLARAFIGAQGGAATEGAPGVDLFPLDGLQPNTLQLITANAFGLEQLDRIFTADYLINDTRMTAFVSQRSDAAAAAELADNYQRSLLTYGATVIEDPVAVQDAAVLQVFDTYEIIFSRG